MNKLPEHQKENRKSQFIEALRLYYDPDATTYTGLNQRYVADLLDWIRCYEWVDLSDPRHYAPRLFPVPDRDEEELWSGIRGVSREAEGEKAKGGA